MVGRIGGPALPADREPHWGGGQGIYFSGRDEWVQGSSDERDDPGHQPGR